MPDRVVVGSITHGEGNERVILGPGERFNTDTLKWSEEYIAELDARGVIRAPLDDTGRAPATAGPGEEVTENRTVPRAEPEARGRRRTENIDL